MNNFTKNDLKTGDFVIMRDRDIGVVVRDLDTVVCKSGYHLPLNNISEDMTSTSRNECDIVEVYRGNKCFKSATGGNLIFHRDEVEEMTLEEVCKALGKNVKIVKEK